MGRLWVLSFKELKNLRSRVKSRYPFRISNRSDGSEEGFGTGEFFTGC